jgi:hypothetical protein
MFISRAQLTRSLRALDTVHPFFGTVFLAFKETGLPVGERFTELNFTNTIEAILKKYYYPLPGHIGFYSPFKTSNKANRWQGERYASTTLQRITVDTFGDAFIHPKGSQQWSWQPDYVRVLANHLPKGKVPVFDLAVWLYRQEELLSSTDAGMLIERFLGRFDITHEEAEALFDFSSPSLARNWYQTEPLTNADVLGIIGYPSGAKAAPNGVIRSLELSGVGPSHQLRYEPAPRLNLITGDNSLGKTFLFDCMWWAITRQWPNHPARPRRDLLFHQVQTPTITYTLHATNGQDIREQQIVSPYDWSRQRWTEPARPSNVEAGLAIYARFDGSFEVWDATMQELGEPSRASKERGAALALSSKAVWEGVPNSNDGWVCNGLLRDWTTWQLSSDYYGQEWNALKACLTELTKDSDQPFSPGKPEKVNIGDASDIPVLIMPYGSVPIIHASAGIRRILALAYMLVWSWFRHRSNSDLLGQEPQRRLVLLLDEAEAHLHPRWQRAIVPAVMAAIDSLTQGMSPQIHLATHSPLVMASAEVVFNERIDDSHHLHLTHDGVVELRELDFFKRGTADRWLLADEFETTPPRSLPSEKAIKEALAVQRESPEKITRERVVTIDKMLRNTLGERDEFWPRWLYFAQQYGVQVARG